MEFTRKWIDELGGMSPGPAHTRKLQQILGYFAYLFEESSSTALEEQNLAILAMKGEVDTCWRVEGRSPPPGSPIQRDPPKRRVRVDPDYLLLGGGPDGPAITEEHLRAENDLLNFWKFDVPGAIFEAYPILKALGTDFFESSSYSMAGVGEAGVGEAGVGEAGVGEAPAGVSGELHRARAELHRARAEKAALEARAVYSALEDGNKAAALRAGQLPPEACRALLEKKSLLEARRARAGEEAAIRRSGLEPRQ